MGSQLFKKEQINYNHQPKHSSNLNLITSMVRKPNFLNFKEKAYICVNVACSCGLTSSNYSELVELYKSYSAQGLEILGFPCNQFMGQESQPEPEIKEFVISKYGKIEVNGQNTHEIYRYLRLNSTLKVNSNEAKEVPWNFGKFLLNSQGQVVKFYHPDIKPKEMLQEIEKLLNQ